MPLRFTHRILEHLAHTNYEPATGKAIARQLGTDPQDRAVFQKAIDQLREQGRVDITRDELVALPSYGEEVEGVFRLTSRGFGFVIPDHPCREGDLFVPPGGTRDAISGDRVRAKVIRQSGRSRGRPGRSPFTGRILEVLERGRDNFVGVLFERGGQWFVEPDGRVLYEPVLIRDPHAKSAGRARAGDKVVIELMHYPDDRYVPEGVITRVLGEAGKPDVETEAVIAAHGLRTEFPDAVVKRARKANRAFEAAARGPWPDRDDLRDLFTFTIDPPDAKDFDDAISISHDAGADEWTLGVHIADVAHFVRPGSPLDDEAKQRGNSVYLPRRVIPMLPEILSNGVCSLQEGVPRFAKSAFVTFDGRGRVLRQRLASTVISSRKRLTYLEAQALIDGDPKAARTHARTKPAYSDELIEALRLADDLARRLRKRRLRDGMIVLQLPEVELVFDDAGHVIDAVPEDDAFTHTIIEMFMVEANEALARTFNGVGVPIIRRIHPEPVRGDLEELRMYARAAGQSVPDEPTRHDLQRLLEATRDTPAVRAIHFAVLRTLTKATYSPALIGHFALASDHYTHFTSPIRRYPDLSLHCALGAYLDATDNGRKVPGGRKRRELGLRLIDDDRVLDEAALVELGRHCSETEVEADRAERELRDFLVMQFLAEHHLGDDFSGVVTGVTGSGLYVSIERFLVEGMVKVQDLPAPGGGADRWETNEQTGRLVARRSGASLGIGDLVTVRILRIDLGSRHLDLQLVGSPEAPVAPAADAKTGGRRRKTTATKEKGKGKGYKKGRRGKRSR